VVDLVREGRRLGQRVAVICLERRVFWRWSGGRGGLGPVLRPSPGKRPADGRPDRGGPTSLAPGRRPYPPDRRPDLRRNRRPVRVGPLGGPHRARQPTPRCRRPGGIGCGSACSGALPAGFAERVLCVSGDIAASVAAYGTAPAPQDLRGRQRDRHRRLRPRRATPGKFAGNRGYRPMPPSSAPWAA